MANSQNGYPVLWSARTGGKQPRIRNWHIPGTNIYLPLRDGSTGFLLAHFALWHHEKVDQITARRDDWGYALRRIAGSSYYSNHSSGTAVDIDAVEHPQGYRYTYGPKDRALVNKRLHEVYKGVIRWGATFPTPDEMHYEIDKPLGAAEKVARELIDSTRGKKICSANAGSRAFILS